MNPFVKIKSTNEIGRIDLSKQTQTDKPDEIEVEFYDAPTRSFKRMHSLDDIEKFTPETNGLVWVPTIEKIRDTDFVVYHRGIFSTSIDSGQWAIFIRFLNSKPNGKIQALVDPGTLVILRSGASMDVPACLGDRLTMSSKYAVTRQQLLVDLYRQMRVARGYRSILSSGVRPFIHQINTMVRVMTDPTPRFILADEVGLGKTIEAGLIIRQTLLEKSDAQVTIICPEFLVGQWQKELAEKLLLSDALKSQRVRIIGFSEVKNLASNDIIVVDEAHRLTTPDNQKLYESVEKGVGSTTTLLLLTATPMRGNREDFLRLLHLVDPDNYSLDSLEEFELRMSLRERSARLIDAIQIKSLSGEVLLQYLGRLEPLFPNDKQVEELLKSLRKQISSDEDTFSLQTELSTYLRESYRVSRRVIRNRRDVVAEEGFVVSGRELKDGMPQFIEEESRPSVDGFITNLLAVCRQTLENDLKSFEEICKIVDPIIEAALSAPEVISSELKSSNFLENGLGFGSEIAEHARNLVEQIDSSKHSNRWDDAISTCGFHIQHPTSSGAVVFVRNTDVALQFANELIAEFGAHQVKSHVSTMSQREQDSAIADFLSISGSRVLVMDQSGEEGRNLQDAREIIHFSLPLSPNKLEQRLGRADRFKERAKERAASRVYVESSSSLSDGQYRYLSDGLSIFDRSVATAQQFLSYEYESLFRRLLSHGLDAFEDDFEELSEKLQDQIDEIASIDLLESSASPEEFSLFDFQELLEVDEESDIEDHALGLYIDDKNRNPPTTPLGLFSLPSKWQNQDLTQTLRLGLEMPNGREADLRDLASENRKEINRLVARDHEYAFSRPVARALPHSFLYRVGDPLVDWTMQYIEGDQMGRTWAVWRQVPNIKSPVVLFSATLKVDHGQMLQQLSSSWGQMSFLRRLELLMPQQLVHLASVNGQVFDHSEPAAKKNIPWVRLTDINMGRRQWGKAMRATSNFREMVENASEKMLGEASSLIAKTDELNVRRENARATHEVVRSILLHDANSSESPTCRESRVRLDDEDLIFNSLMNIADNPPVEILSMGMIYLTSEPA